MSRHTTAIAGSIGVLAALAWATIRVAPQTLVYPSFDAQRALAWPNPSLRAEEAYTQTSPVDAILYQVLGLDTTNTWIALHVAAIVVAVALLGSWLMTSPTLPWADRRASLRLLALSPVVALLLMFIGSYDPFTIAGIAGLLYAWRSNSRLWLIAAGTFMGFAHAEQAGLAIIALAVAFLGGRQLLPAELQRLRTPVWALLGVAIGRLALTVILTANGVGEVGGRFDWLTGDGLLRLALVGSINFFPILLMSAFAGLWVMVVLTLLHPQRARTSLAWAIPLAALFFVSLTVLDHTRVFVITSLPILMVLLHAYVSGPRRELSKAARITIEAAAWIIVPLSVLTSPDGPTYLVDLNIADHWNMWLSRITGGGWA